jgi:hypothetical protein
MSLFTVQYPTPEPRSACLRLGITGHSNLTPASEILVEKALHSVLRGRARRGALVGVSCLAAGADRAFARAVLDLGGALEVVIPAQDYRSGHVGVGEQDEFDRLVAAAGAVRTLAFERSCRQAYVAASDAMLTDVDEVLAVWDGHSATLRGSTAEVVAEARHRRLPVTVIWPPHVARIPRT